MDPLQELGETLRTGTIPVEWIGGLPIGLNVRKPLGARRTIPAARLQISELLHWEVAAGWMTEPALIVVSPFVRTQLTAHPTLLRFPHVPVVGELHLRSAI